MTTTSEIIAAKAAKTNFKIHGGIASRFSPRFYAPDPIPTEDLQSIFEAARWAPSGRNLQPWFFYWMRTGTDSYSKLLSCIPERHNWVKTAPVFLLNCYNANDAYGVNEFALYDLGASVITLIYQATKLGYHARQVGNFDRKKAKEILTIENDLMPFTMIALGKIGDYTKADPKIAAMDLEPRLRKEIVAEELK
jgi:nitroreductase